MRHGIKLQRKLSLSIGALVDWRATPVKTKDKGMVEVMRVVGAKVHKEKGLMV